MKLQPWIHSNQRSFRTISQEKISPPKSSNFRFTETLIRAELDRSFSEHHNFLSTNRDWAFSLKVVFHTDSRTLKNTWTSSDSLLIFLQFGSWSVFRCSVFHHFGLIVLLSSQNDQTHFSKGFLKTMTHSCYLQFVHIALIKISRM